MVFAVVLVNADVGEENIVLESIKKVSGVEEAHALWGIYDILVKVKANSIDKLKEVIKLGLRQVTGVSGVLTLMIVDHTGM